MAIKYYTDSIITGLSTDTKPANVPDGSFFIEVDTQKLYVKNAGAWTLSAGATTPKIIRGIKTVGDGSDGSVTISVDTDLGTANFKQYQDLTINAGVNLTGNSPLVILVKGTLTLNGTIHQNGKGNAGGAGGGFGGVGGNGGGVLIVICNAIAGTGTLSANGANGGAGSGGAASANGSDSTDGSSPVQTVTGSRGRGNSAGTGGPASTAFATVDIALGTALVTSFTIPGGGGGGMGGASSNAGGGGGGGPGGIVILVVNGATTGITITVNGGVGGNASGNLNQPGGGGSGGACGGAGGAGGNGGAGGAGPGGGGGAGVIIVYATSDITTKQVNGGAAGTGGNAGAVAGTAGITRSLTI